MGVKNFLQKLEVDHEPGLTNTQLFLNVSVILIYLIWVQ